MSDISGLYLFDAPLSGAEHVDYIAWDEYHGRHCHEPANRLAPQGVHILPQAERSHLNGTEGKHPLQNHIITVTAFNLRLERKKMKTALTIF